jgi:glutamine ABC superfamily ATP binding cassette transporter, permease/substrate-binding protein
MAWRLLCFAVLCLGLFACGKKSTGKIQGREIRLGIDRDNAPFSYVQEDGSPAGFDVELMEEIAKLEGFTIKFVPMNPSALESSVVTGTIVGAIGGVEIREEEKQVVFSESYGSSSIGLLSAGEKERSAEADSSIFGDFIRTPESTTATKGKLGLRDKKILVKEGSGTAAYLESIRLEEGFILVVVQENEDLLREWMEGNGDLIGEDIPVLSAMKEEILKMEAEAKNDQEERKAKGEMQTRLQDFSGIEIRSLEEKQSYGLMVGKGQNKELLRAFVRGLKKMKEDGEWETLTKKYSLFSSNSNPQ